MEEIKISLQYQTFLGRHLRYGDGKKIAKSVGTDAVYVSQIMNGKRPARTFKSQAVVKEARRIVRVYYENLQSEINHFEQSLNEVHYD